MQRIPIFIILLVSLCCSATAQEARKPLSTQASFGVAYYNVDKLYDTQPSDLYDDSHYTPQGSMRWNEQRYRTKIQHTVEVIDSIALPVVVLFGVEDEQVVRDLVGVSCRDYAYIHHDQNINNGLEFAVLYQADKFFPEKVTRWERALCIEGYAGDTALTIIANYGCTSTGVLMKECGIDVKSDNIILIGQPSKANLELLGLRDATRKAEELGRGNYTDGSRWIMRDRVATNIEGEWVCDVLIKSWLLDDSGKPANTFNRKRYNGAYSSHLPIYIYFEDLFAY